MKVVITNQVACNTGDAAILMGLRKLLKDAFGEQVVIEIVDRHAVTAGALYDELSFHQAFRYDKASVLSRFVGKFERIAYRIMPSASYPILTAFFESALLATSGTLRSNKKLYKSADLVVSTGGTYLVEHYDLRANLLQISLALRCGQPTLLFTQSLGPFKKAHNQWRVRSLLSRCAAIFLRDERSKLHLEAIGCDTTKAKIVADSAFLLFNQRTLNVERDEIGKTNLRIAISVRDWRFPGSSDPDRARTRYLNSVRDLAQHLVERHNASICFLSSCQGVSAYDYDDSSIARDVVSGLPATNISINDRFHSPSELRDKFAEFDLIVSTRMHSAILALCAGVPAFAIAYETKTIDLFSSMGLGDHFLEIENVNSDRLIDKVDHLVDYAQVYRRRLPTLISAVFASAAIPGDDFARLFERKV